MRWHYFRRVGSHSRAAVRPTERVVRLRQPPRWQFSSSAGRQWSPTRRLIHFISFGRAAGYEPSNIAPGPRWADFRSFAAVLDQRRGSPWVTSRNICCQQITPALPPKGNQNKPRQISRDGPVAAFRRDRLETKTDATLRLPDIEMRSSLESNRSPS